MFLVAVTRASSLTYRDTMNRRQKVTDGLALFSANHGQGPVPSIGDLPSEGRRRRRPGARPVYRRPTLGGSPKGDDSYADWTDILSM